MTSLDALHLGYIDAHCHLADSRLDEIRDEVIYRAGVAGVSRFIQGGVGPEDWQRQLALVAKYPGQISPSFGLHPWWVSSHSDSDCEAAFLSLARLLKDSRPCGLGELGLDFGSKQLVQGEGVQARQIRFFERQLALAEEETLPLILHLVYAHAEALAILESFGRDRIQKLGGIVHSFSGNLQAARSYLNMGLKISISGSVITRKSGKAFEKLKQAVVSLPLESLVIETDSPDQPPADFLEADGSRKLNEPVTLLKVAAAVGRFKNVSQETVLNQSRHNLEAIFSPL